MDPVECIRAGEKVPVTESGGGEEFAFVFPPGGDPSLRGRGCSGGSTFAC